MSLALALWLLAAAAFVGYRIGRRSGRAEYARHVESELGPLLPMLEELRQDEAKLRLLCTDQMEALERFRRAARSN